MSSPTSPSPPAAPVRADDGPSNFVRELVQKDVEAGKHGGRVATRFPPEPNGYLHIGHAKSICLNFGTALEFKGTCNLRFDDTNPTTEDVEYVESIQADVRWLGFSWDDRLFYASDYYDRLHAIAVALIEKGLAYVDEQPVEAIREQRGNFYKPGVESPHRSRPVAENLALFERMRQGELPDGAMVLRAKIDMQSRNLNLRDPTIYRIRHAHHHRTGDKWCIYPMYDYAHGYCDAFEGITHSVCTLEFEDHRPLYDWFLDQAPEPLPSRPQQIEFARLNLTYTVLSKRKLLELVSGKHVAGWDDPRMPTLAGLRRRGYTPEAIRNFCERIGVSKRDSLVDVTLLEHALREDLERRAPRTLGVLRPLKVVIENLGEDEAFDFEVPNHPEDPSFGTRTITLTRELWIDRDDFREEAPKKWFRLAPGAEVRLKYACLVRCTSVVKDPATGEVTELRCTWDPASKGGSSPDGRKVKGTIHWLSAAHAVPAEARLYDRLFSVENPSADEGVDWKSHINPQSLQVLKGAMVEATVAKAAPGTRFQLERTGYFTVDLDSTPGAPVINRTIELKDGWAKIEKKEGA